jgi:hypothetical protein
MKNHTIRVTPPGDVLKREEELAWLLAATAVDPTPIDSEVQDMVINRIIDSVALAIAGVTADPVVRAQAQALAQHSVLLTTYPTNGGDESDVRVDHLARACAEHFTWSVCGTASRTRSSRGVMPCSRFGRRWIRRCRSRPRPCRPPSVHRWGL